MHADQALLTPGSTLALFILAMVMYSGDDEIIDIVPYFPPVKSFFNVSEAIIHTVRHTFDKQYRLEISNIEHKISDKTRLLYLVSPQNPSDVELHKNDVRQFLIQ